MTSNESRTATLDNEKTPQWVELDKLVRERPHSAREAFQNMAMRHAEALQILADHDARQSEKDRA